MSGRVFSRGLAVASMAVAAGAFVLTTTGCDAIKKLTGLGRDMTTETLNVLDDAIDALGNTSADWQQVLADAQRKLTEDTQATVRNEIGVIASRSIAQTGVELRCNADFIRGRVRQALVGLKAKVLGQPVPAVEPGLCQVVPIAVDRESVPDHVKVLEFYGYDFDQQPGFRVFHETSAGRQDVTPMLDRPTHYAMTLRFGGGGVQLNDQSRRFVVEWQGRPVSTVAVIQPQTPVCETRVANVDPGSVTFIPPHTRGDSDFDGHGPNVTATVTVLSDPQQLRARVYMKAEETTSDWTTSEGTGFFPLYSAPPGWRIERVTGNLSSTCSYTDSNHEEDSFNVGAGGPAKRFLFTGDTNDDEAGTRTKVRVDFNRLVVEETQNANCVSPQAITFLNAAGLIKANVYTRLARDVRFREATQRHP